MRFAGKQCLWRTKPAANPVSPKDFAWRFFRIGGGMHADGEAGINRTAQFFLRRQIAQACRGTL